MTVQLSSLRVAPELDASKYTAGAQQKVAADRAMAASSAAAGSAVAATDTKISQAGDVLARLSRQYIDGYSAQQKFSQGLGQLQRGLESGKISIEGAERILVGMNQKLGLMGDASDLASKGQMQLAAAVKAANAQIAGQAIAAENATAAAKRMMAANANAPMGRQNNFAALNATNQFQDIAITAAMGQSLTTIALQQGTQLGMAMEMSAGAQGAAGAVKMLGSAIMGLFTPINLAAIGITAVAAATIQWFMKGKDGAKTLDETLKAHSGTLQLLKDQYGELGEVAKRVGTIGGPGLAMADSRATLAIWQAQIREQMNPLTDAVRGGGFLRQGLFGSRDANLAELTELAGNNPYKKIVDDFLAAVRSGKGDLADFDKRLMSVFDTLRQSSDAPAALHEEMQRLNDAAVDLFSVPEKFAPFANAINQLSLEGANGLSDFIAEVDKLGQAPGLRKAADELVNLGKEAVVSAEKAKDLEATLNRIGARQRGPLIGSPDEDDRLRYFDDQRVALTNARRQFDADMFGLGARSPQELAAAARAREEARDVKNESPELRNQRIELAGRRALLEAEHGLKEAREERIRSLDQSIASQRLEMELIGATAGEGARLRFEFERIQELREEAARTGIAVDEKELALIKAKAEEYGKFADALARANLQRELQFERDQLSRTSADQEIASRLRSAGLPVSLNSPEAAEMRDLERIRDLRDNVRGFFDDFRDGLKRGEDFGESLGKSILNALSRSLDKSLDNIFDYLATSIVDAITGASRGGSSSGGSIISDIVGSVLGKGAANDNHAPGAVTRAPLPNVGGDIAGYIQQAASLRGIDPGIALRVARSEGLAPGVWQSNVFKNGVREPSFGPFQLLKGGPGTGFPVGLGNDFMRQTGLDPANPANVRPGIDFALNHASKNGWGAWYGAKAAGIGNFEGLEGASSKAVGALDRLATGSDKLGGVTNALAGSTRNAAGGLDAFGGGLNKMGNMLNQFPAAPSGGGGIGGFFKNIFGGGGLPSFSFMNAISPAATAHILGGGVGLFADGTEGAPPGWAWVGEKGPELRKLRAGDVIRTHQRSVQMAANANAPAPQSVHVTVSVDDDGKIKAYVTDMGRQAAQAGAQLGARQVRQSLPSMMADAQARSM